MNKKEIKNTNEAEEIKVEMIVEETEPKETKKDKAWNFAKKVGKAIWAGVKTTCTGVGAIVIGALTVGLVLGGKKNNDSESEYSGGELDIDGSEPVSNEISEETSNEGFDL